MLSVRVEVCVGCVKVEVCVCALSVRVEVCVCALSVRVEVCVCVCALCVRVEVCVLCLSGWRCGRGHHLLLTVCLVDAGDLWHQRIIRVRVTEQRADGEEH